MSLVDKRLTLSTNLSKKCVDALYAQLDDNALPKNASPQDKINKLNTFLEEIKRALLCKTM